MLSAVERPLLVVDAWNVIRSRWPNLEPERFLALVQRWADAADAEALVVFDRQAPEPPAGVEVVGTGAESADDWIARHAPRWDDAKRRLWFVTSDRELRRRLEPYAERTVGGGAFAGELEALERN